LHLLNVKLNLDVSFNSTQNGISSEHLNAFAQQLNRWIKPVESKHEVVLCQNAAFSLKLIAKRIPPNDSAPALSSSIALCTELLGNWRSFDEAMVGSILLLAGELVRRQSTRNTLQYVNKLCAISLDILMEQLDSSASQQQQQHVVSP
uniref:HEAT repeat-containing protein 1 n=1 Tax=Anisakis simplex TaxID=6269 RepID=A0A0M3JG65_ANISI